MTQDSFEPAVDTAIEILSEHAAGYLLIAFDRHGDIIADSSSRPALIASAIHLVMSEDPEIRSAILGAIAHYAVSHGTQLHVPTDPNLN